MDKSILFLLLLIISPNFLKLSAQNQKTDSLENLLQQHDKKDTTRVNLLNETALQFSLIDNEKLLKYAVGAIELSEKLPQRAGL